MQPEKMKKSQKLVRPSGLGNHFEDGIYRGELLGALLAERDCMFNNTGRRLVLELTLEVEQDQGESRIFYESANYSWHPLSKMTGILENLGMLPEPGESLELENLTGMPVEVEVRNVEKNGVSYCNVIYVRRLVN